MADLNIDSLSSEELDALKKKIEAKQKIKQDRERSDFIAEVSPRAKILGLKLVNADTGKDVKIRKTTAVSSTSGKKRKTKTYKNPTTGETWIKAGAAARKENIPSWVKKPDGTVNEDYLKKD